MQDAFDDRPTLEIPPFSYQSRRALERASANNRRLAIIAASFGVFLVAVGGIWEFAARQTQGIPVIEADSRPIRVKPDNPGGMQVLGANEDILSGTNTTNSAETLVAPPEAPDVDGLRAQQQAAADRQRQQMLAAQSAIAAQGVVPPSVQASLSQPGSSASDVPLPPMISAAPEQAPAQAAPYRRGAQANPAASTRPDTRTDTRAASVRSASPAPAAATAAPSSTAAVATAGGGKQVQILAAGSEEAATAEWDKLAKRMPDVFAGRRPEVSRIEHDGHVFYRLRTGGFADAGQASAFCAKLKAKGAGCAVF